MLNKGEKEHRRAIAELHRAMDGKTTDMSSILHIRNCPQCQDRILKSRTQALSTGGHTRYLDTVAQTLRFAEIAAQTRKV